MWPPTSVTELTYIDSSFPVNRQKNTKCFVVKKTSKHFSPLAYHYHNLNSILCLSVITNEQFLKVVSQIANIQLD
jgi:hypothetical protein